MDLYEALDHIKARRPIARFKIVAVEIQKVQGNGQMLRLRIGLNI